PPTPALRSACTIQDPVPLGLAFRLWQKSEKRHKVMARMVVTVDTGGCREAG
ncbi:hypothetical protein EGM_02520, partial [Macaca fascicularis]